MEAIFANIQNGLLFRILGVFKSGFWIEQLYSVCRFVFDMFLGILIFGPKVMILESLCMEAIFANIQNGLIFRILGVFKSGFLQKTTIFCV